MNIYKTAQDFVSRLWGNNRPTIKEMTNLTGFKCECCGQICNFLDLEYWCCDFDENNPEILCSICYETDMGDDL